MATLLQKLNTDNSGVFNNQIEASGRKTKDIKNFEVMGRVQTVVISVFFALGCVLSSYVSLKCGILVLPLFYLYHEFGLAIRNGQELLRSKNDPHPIEILTFRDTPVLTTGTRIFLGIYQAFN